METRQKRIVGLWALTMAGAGALGLGAGALMVFGDGIPLWALLLGVCGVMVLAYPLCLPLWRKLDEMAKQAHLVSWFWGGSIGGGMALVAVYALALRGEAPEAVLSGGLLVMGAQIIGYVLVWAGWWLRRRAGAA